MCSFAAACRRDGTATARRSPEEHAFPLGVGAGLVVVVPVVVVMGASTIAMPVAEMAYHLAPKAELPWPLV